ncbi:hypothetical protein B0H13DRAFT_1882333 [Mycena leptocephala]|nr:hypothetical protein B0H13DRAFT_1882333 [Mycena leptocephala]
MVDGSDKGARAELPLRESTVSYNAWPASAHIHAEAARRDLNANARPTATQQAVAAVGARPPTFTAAYVLPVRRSKKRSGIRDLRIGFVLGVHVGTMDEQKEERPGPRRMPELSVEAKLSGGRGESPRAARKAALDGERAGEQGSTRTWIRPWLHPKWTADVDSGTGCGWHRRARRSSAACKVDEVEVEALTPSAAAQVTLRSDCVPAASASQQAQDPRSSEEGEWRVKEGTGILMSPVGARDQGREGEWNRSDKKGGEGSEYSPNPLLTRAMTTSSPRLLERMVRPGDGQRHAGSVDDTVVGDSVSGTGPSDAQHQSGAVVTKDDGGRRSTEELLTAAHIAWERCQNPRQHQIIAGGPTDYVGPEAPTGCLRTCWRGRGWERQRVQFSLGFRHPTLKQNKSGTTESAGSDPSREEITPQGRALLVPSVMSISNGQSEPNKYFRWTTTDKLGGR